MFIDNRGVSVGIERVGSRDFFLTIKAVGQITHEDYLHILPVIEGAIKGVRDPKINALINLAEFEGWADLEAIWDDIKFGIEHRKEFNKIAVICDGSWQELMIKAVSIFMSGEVREFQSLNSAKEWLLD
jgi:hypothetical protein